MYYEQLKNDFPQTNSEDMNVLHSRLFTELKKVVSQSLERSTDLAIKEDLRPTKDSQLQ